MSLTLSQRSPRGFRSEKRSIEAEAFSQWLEDAAAAEKKKLRSRSADDDGESAFAPHDSLVRKKKRPGWLRPAGVSLWSKMKDSRWKERDNSSSEFEGDPLGLGVCVSSSKHRSPASIAPIGATSAVKKKVSEFTAGCRHPPPGTYSLPDLWSNGEVKRYPSRFSQRAEEVIRQAKIANEKTDAWAVYPADGRFRLPLTDEEKAALRRSRNAMVKRGIYPAKKTRTSRRNAVLLDGKESEFQDGRDNLLIRALMREEQDRKVGYKGPAETKEEEMPYDEEFEKMFEEETKIGEDELEVIIRQSEADLREL